MCSEIEDFESGPLTHWAIGAVQLASGLFRPVPNNRMSVPVLPRCYLREINYLSGEEGPSRYKD
jgi:hypothetical protein